MTNKFLMLVAAVILASCASLPDERQDVVYNMSYGYYSVDLKPLPNVYKPQPPTLLFPSVPGAFYGAPDWDLLVQIVPVEEDRFVLELPGNADQYAQELDDPRLKVSPANTRLMRLGTFHFYGEDPHTLGGGAFTDLSTGDFIMLVYVSKPSHITGTIRLGQELHRHDVKLPTAGWHWVHGAQVSETEVLLTRYQADLDNLQFSVISEDSEISI